MLNVFNEPQEEIKELLSELPRFLEKALPLRLVHKIALPQNIRILSEILTQHRSELARPYFSDPKFLSAYLWYFLPWNLSRLALLLPSLPLELENNDSILDLGSGPLTFPLALWLFCPHLRPLNLTFACVDTSPSPLLAGQKIFEALTEGKSPWKIIPVQGTLKQGFAKLDKKPKLVAALNVFNELRRDRGVSLELSLKKTIMEIQTRLAPSGAIFLLEPGNRLGGKIVATVREIARSHGFTPVAPCTHNNACPRLDTRNSWCHFNTQNIFFPHWLRELSKVAGLQKSNLALSFVLLSETSPPKGTLKKVGAELPGPKPAGKKLVGRIISQAFFASGMENKFCSYACAANGLTLINSDREFPSGSELTFTLTGNEKIDEKNKIPIIVISASWQKKG